MLSVLITDLLEVSAIELGSLELTRVLLESTPGQGSTFSLVLPC